MGGPFTETHIAQFTTLMLSALARICFACNRSLSQLGGVWQSVGENSMSLGSPASVVFPC